MVSVSRIIDQDVNVFVRDVLVATSQRDLFASGLLPTRIPAEVARAIGLERQSSYVGDERLGRLEYTVAAVPVRDGESGAILTVPLTLRQQEIEGEVAALDRRVILAAVLFILLGAAIGYVTAERLGDPIQRLTRATGRIARGDLNARILTAPADELGPPGRGLQPDGRRTSSASAPSSSGPIVWRRGPTWRARSRTTSRTR